MGKFPPSVEDLERVDKLCFVEDSVIKSVMVRFKPYWNMVTKTDRGGYFQRGRVQVGVSVQKYQDREIWLHVSACRRKPDELPTWEDMKRVKRDFIGQDGWAYQVFPSEDEYVNHHPFVLHLFARIDGKAVLPDFTYGLGTL